MGFMKKLWLLILVLLITSCAGQTDRGSAYSANDQRFAAMMIPHHEQAIVMSELALTKSSNAEILALAQEIRDAQSPEIEQMKTWVDSHMGSHAGHVMDGMLSDEEMQELSDASGANFDRLFLVGMIKHHEGAIEMAEMVVNSENNEVSLLANAIISGQRAEVERMKVLLGR
jgi:uncharacterized protein (DUF305 family)